MQGVRGSTVNATATPAVASRRRLSGPPWRLRSGRSRSTASTPSRTATATPCRAVRGSRPPRSGSAPSATATRNSRTAARSCRVRSSSKYRPWSALCFVACTARGALAMMRRGVRRVRPRADRPAGTTAFNRPISSARCAGTRSAHSRNSIACAHGICRGSRTVVPPPAKSPRLGSMTANFASGHATRMSHPPSISMPPAVQKPLTAAMTGLYSGQLRSTARTPSSIR